MELRDISGVKSYLINSESFLILLPKKIWRCYGLLW